MSDLSDLPQTRAAAAALDRADPLAPARAAFAPVPGIAYLAGHSLGPPTRAALDAVAQAAQADWAERLVGAWNAAGWIDLAGRVAARIAPLIGAEPGTVAVTDSVSVNLFKLAAAAVPLARRRAVLVEADEFPTDAYVADGLAGLTGAAYAAVPPGEGPAAMDGGVLIKSAVNFRTGLIADMAGHEAAARQTGGVIVWDLSHATGMVPVDLHRAGARFAAGCTYKYLNGGPGAPAFLYAREPGETALRGWFGHEAPFAFDLDFRPRSDAGRHMTGTPPILSLVALDAALDAFADIDPGALHEKAGRLGDMLLARGEALGLPAQVPRDRRVRGGHVSMGHEDGYEIIRCLIARGVTGDFRTPDTIRFGCSPLFLSYEDVWRAGEALAEVIETRAFDDARFRAREAVT